MIDEDGKSYVFLATIDYGCEEGGAWVCSVNDTYDGASKELHAIGFRPGCVFTSRGELYAFKGKTADEFPYAYIDKRQVRP